MAGEPSLSPADSSPKRLRHHHRHVEHDDVDAKAEEGEILDDGGGAMDVDAEARHDHAAPVCPHPSRAFLALQLELLLLILCLRALHRGPVQICSFCAATMAVRRLILNIKPKDIGSLISNFPGDDPKMLSNFKDLLEKIFVLDPEKRITVSQALSHPFITAMRSEYVDEAWNHGRDGCLTDLAACT